MKKSEKLYVYVDESGQDRTSRFFIVVAVASVNSNEEMRSQLLMVEDKAKTNGLKWHKTKEERRIQYLALVLENKIASGNVYVVSYKKPIPYFFPMIDAVVKAVKNSIHGQYSATVYVDGIDRQKAIELTNALRGSGISLRMVKGRRDESEPIIRLADMWAGCIREAFLQPGKAKDTLEKARKTSYFGEAPET